MKPYEFTRVKLPLKQTDSLWHLLTQKYKYKGEIYLEIQRSPGLNKFFATFPIANADILLLSLTQSSLQTLYVSVICIWYLHFKLTYDMHNIIYASSACRHILCPPSVTSSSLRV